MAGRTAHPWFYAAKNAWYVKVGNKKVALGVSGEENKADALTAWHKLMADGPKPTPEPKADVTVKAVIDAFLTDAETRVQPITMQFYRKFCLSFSADHGTCRADALTLASEEAWARKPKWIQSSRHDALGVLATAFRWAAGFKGIDAKMCQSLNSPNWTVQHERRRSHSPWFQHRRS